MLAKRVGQFLAGGDHVTTSLKAADQLVRNLGEIRRSGVNHHMGTGAQDVPWFAADDYSQVALRAHNASQILAHLLRIQVNGANDVKVRLLQPQAHDSRADGPNPVLDDANFMSGQEGLQPDPPVRKDLILHEGWRPFSDGKPGFKVSGFKVSRVQTCAGCRQNPYIHRLTRRMPSSG